MVSEWIRKNCWMLWNMAASWNPPIVLRMILEDSGSEWKQLLCLSAAGWLLRAKRTVNFRPIYGIWTSLRKRKIGIWLTAQRSRLRKSDMFTSWATKKAERLFFGRILILLRSRVEMFTQNSENTRTQQQSICPWFSTGIWMVRAGIHWRSW